MNQKLKQKWVKALRSGRYKQARGALKVNGGYCCLGVLRQIMHKGSKRGDQESGTLCAEHLKEAGFSRRTEDSLVGKNDCDRWTFKQIADYIERRM